MCVAILSGTTAGCAKVIESHGGGGRDRGDRTTKTTIRAGGGAIASRLVMRSAQGGHRLACRKTRSH